MNIDLYVILFILLLFPIGAMWCRNSEDKAWNNGVCPCEKGFWKSFDMDSQGGVGYKCTDLKCNNVIWQSWRCRQ